MHIKYSCVHLVQNRRGNRNYFNCCVFDLRNYQFCAKEPCFPPWERAFGSGSCVHCFFLYEPYHDQVFPI